MRSACYFDEILDYLLSYELNSLIEDELYYYSNTSTIIYTDHPSGELDIERLMDDKPCWFSTCQSKQRVKKNIIIWNIDKLGDIAFQALFHLIKMNEDSANFICVSQNYSKIHKSFFNIVIPFHIENPTKQFYIDFCFTSCLMICLKLQTTSKFLPFI